MVRRERGGATGGGGEGLSEERATGLFCAACVRLPGAADLQSEVSGRLFRS